MKTLRYVTDGTYVLAEVRAKLEGLGVVYEQEPGRVRFVPDDPSFPNTVLYEDGLIELDVESASDPRLEQYLAELSRWLGLGLQQVESR